MSLDIQHHPNRPELDPERVTLGQLLADDVGLRETQAPEPIGKEFVGFFGYSGGRVKFLRQLVGLPSSPYVRARAVRDTVVRAVEAGEPCTGVTGDGKPICAAPIWLTYQGRKLLKGCLVVVPPVAEEPNSDVLIQMTMFNARLYSERISSRFEQWQEREVWQTITRDIVSGGERLAKVFDSIGAGMALMSPDLDVLWQNATAAEYTGAAAVGRKCYRAAFNRDEPCEDCCVLRSLETGLPQSGQMLARFPQMNNRTQHHRLTSIPVVGDDGRVTGVMEIIYDYTRMETAESELSRYKRLVNNSQDFMVIGDKNGTILAVNSRMTAGTGFKESEMLGRNGLFLCAEHEIARALALVANSRAVGLAMGDIHIQTKDGKLIPTQATISYEPEAEVYGVIFRDISERLVMEEQIRQRSEQLHAQNQEVQAALEERTRFFRHVSHELRTPITSVIGFAELLMDDPDEPPSPAQKLALDRIVGNAHKLLGLVNDLLDLSRLEAGAAASSTPVDLAKFLTSTVENMQPLAQDKNLYLRVSVAAGLPGLVVDEQRLSHVIVNLISNAVKFTQTGGVTVRASQSGSWVTVSVRDTGIGIPPEELTNIFREFYQVGNQPSDVRGSGLGLSIVKKTTALLGGRLSVKSKVGVGSTFTVRLPLKPSS